MTGLWRDFNDAQPQQSFDVIPKGTVAPVRMTIKRGNYDDHSKGWTGGFATFNTKTFAIYLNCEFVVLEGLHAKRKIFSLIGLHSKNGPAWENMGRSMVRAILNSARGLSDKDMSPAANAARQINGFEGLDGIEFLAKIDVSQDKNGNDRNEIRQAVIPDNDAWNAYKQAGGQWYPEQLVNAWGQAPQGYAPQAPQGYPPQQPGGYPPQTAPQPQGQAMPPQGQPQGYPQQGAPQGYPQQGHPQQGQMQYPPQQPQGQPQQQPQPNQGYPQQPSQLPPQAAHPNQVYGQPHAPATAPLPQQTSGQGQANGATPGRPTWAQ